MKYKLLVVLQNPYDKGALKNGWNPAYWKNEFLRSRTYARLRSALPWERSGRWLIHFTNANPSIGAGPDSHFDADLGHLRRTLSRVRPDFVLACGKCAEAALVDLWAGPLAIVPHPAHRLVTDSLYERCKHILNSWAIFQDSPSWKKQRFTDDDEWAKEDLPRLAFRQLRGESAIICV